MSSPNVDELLMQLFPAETLGEGRPNSSTDAEQASKQRKPSAWDSESDSEQEGGKAKKDAAAVAAVSHAKPSSAKRPFVAHSFDDSDSDGDGQGGRPNNTRGDAEGKAQAPSPGGELRRGSMATSGKHNTLFAVPFPNLSGLTGLPSCLGRCFVSNKAAELCSGVPEPTVEELQRIASGHYDATSTPKQMMLRKGAYYVQSAKVGNGCLDGGHSAPLNVAGGGGCPNLACRRCSYGVIRLQGAEWVDDDSTMDLYLTLRNYYPDWSRLASSMPVGLSDEEQQQRGFVLRANPLCAAYCCQCCWLTVSCERAVIDTRVSETAFYNGERSTFATKLPLIPGETRRPPLWICKGHYLL